MGTWEVGPFENDAAADFVVEFADKGWRLVERTINRKVKRDDWAIQELIAACEFIAATDGHPLRGGSFDELNDWLDEHEGFELDLKLKKKAIEQAKAVATKSELLDVWADAGLKKAWLKTVQNLIGRLRKTPKRNKRMQPKPIVKASTDGRTKKDAKKVLKKYDGCTAKQQGVRIVTLQIPAPEDAKALLAIDDAGYLALSANEKLDASKQTESVKVLIVGCKQLAWIDLEQFQGLPDCIAEFSIIANRLKSLDLRKCAVNSEVIDAIGRFKKLTRLHIDECGVDDDLARVLARNCKSVEDLILWDKNLTSKSLSSFGSLKRLKSFGIRCPTIEDKDLARFLSTNKKAGWKMERNGQYVGFDRS